MATFDDIQAGYQITSMDPNGRRCTLTSDDDGVAPTDVRVNMPNGLRNKPRDGTADAIAIRNGNLLEVLQFTQYGVVDALGDLDDDETQIHSTGPAPNRISVRDENIRIGSVAQFNEGVLTTRFFGGVIGDADAEFTGDIIYNHERPAGGLPTVSAWFVAANPVPPTVSGHDSGFKVTFSNPAQAIPTGTTIAVINFARAFASAPIVIVSCTGGPGECGKLGRIVTNSSVTLTWKDSTAITQGSTSEFTVIVRGG